MDKSSSKRGYEEYQMKLGENIYKRTALGSLRSESRVEDSCPCFQGVNEEIRRDVVKRFVVDQYLSDVKAHAEYYSSVQRVSLHLMKIAGLAAGQKLSFDIENIPVLMMIFAAVYGNLGMNLKSFEEGMAQMREAHEEIKKRGDKKE